MRVPELKWRASCGTISIRVPTAMRTKTAWLHASVFVSLCVYVREYSTGLTRREVFVRNIVVGLWESPSAAAVIDTNPMPDPSSSTRLSLRSLARRSSSSLQFVQRRRYLKIP
eukprot:9255103-Pyramimonas_sp.AAC.1